MFNYYFRRLIKEALHLPVRLIAGLATGISVMITGPIAGLELLSETILPKHFFSPIAAFAYGAWVWKTMLVAALDNSLPFILQICLVFIYIFTAPIAALFTIYLVVAAQLAMIITLALILCPIAAVAGFIYGAYYGINVFLHPMQTLEGFAHHLDQLVAKLSRKDSGVLIPYPTSSEEVLSGLPIHIRVNAVRFINSVDPIERRILLSLMEIQVNDVLNNLDSSTSENLSAATELLEKIINTNFDLLQEKPKGLQAEVQEFFINRINADLNDRADPMSDGIILCPVEGTVVLLVKLYIDKNDNHHPVPGYALLLTGKNILLKWLARSPSHPLTRDSISSPTDYVQYKQDQQDKQDKQVKQVKQVKESFKTYYQCYEFQADDLEAFIARVSPLLSKDQTHTEDTDNTSRSDINGQPSSVSIPGSGLSLFSPASEIKTADSPDGSPTPH